MSSWLARTIDLLWIACMLSFAFQRVWTLPITDTKLQPPELTGLLLIAAAAIALWRGGWRSGRVKAVAWLDLGVIAWWIAVNVVWLLVTLRGQSNPTVRLDAIGTTYLLLFYAAFRVTASPARLRRSVPSLVAMGLLAAAMSMVGFVAALAGYWMPYVLVGEFPYLGRVIRSHPFMPAPAMTASVVITAFFAWVALRLMAPGRALAQAWVPGCLLASFILTQAKVGVALVCGLLAWLVFRDPRTRWRVPALATIGLLVAIFAVGSHVVVVRADASAELTRALVKERYVGEAPLGVINLFGTDLALFRSNYWMNKRASILAIEETWPIGLGHGGQRPYVARLMREGRHPTTMWAADPHSTYTGTLAELGLAGAVALPLVVGCLIADIRLLRRASDPTIAALGAVLAGALVTVAIECIATDVMSFRHYWVALALIAALSTLIAPETAAHDARLDDGRKSL